MAYGFNNFTVPALIIFSSAYARFKKNAINSYLVKNVSPYVICSASKCCVQIKVGVLMYTFQLYCKLN